MQHLHSLAGTQAEAEAAGQAASEAGPTADPTAAAAAWWERGASHSPAGNAGSSVIWYSRLI